MMGVVSVNMSECPNVPGKSRWEVFMKGTKPDIQECRMFPYLCPILALDFNGDKELNTNQAHWVHGLYCGPYCNLPLVLPTSGVVRVAIREETTSEESTPEGIRRKKKTRLKIIATSKVQAVTMGGNLQITEAANNGAAHLLAEGRSEETPVQDIIRRVRFEGVDESRQDGIVETVVLPDSDGEENLPESGGGSKIPIAPIASESEEYVPKTGRRKKKSTSVN